MNNSQITPNCSNSPSKSQASDCDSEAVDYKKQNYQYLINELKMKNTALAKASNLIQILKVELEVEKSSKKEAVKEAEEQLRTMYDIEIANLNAKIVALEENNGRRKVSALFCTQPVGIENIPRPESKNMRRSNSKSLNRSQSKQNLCAKQKNNNKISSDLSIQTKMYRKMLLVNSLWDNQFINDFEDLMRVQTADIENIVRTLEEFDTQFQNSLASNWKNPKKYNVFTRYQELQQLVEKQSEIIADMKIYQSQLENIIKGLSQKINSFYEERSNTNRIMKWTQRQVGQTIKQTMQILRKWKLKNLNRQKRMEEENKELRQIVEEMISLINKKKQASSKDSTIRNI